MLKSLSASYVFLAFNISTRGLIKSILPGYLDAEMSNSQSSSPHIVGNWNGTENLWYTMLRIRSFYTCIGSFRRMLKTRIPLGNISRVLTNSRS